MPSLSDLIPNNNVYGYKVRQPYKSEDKFFKKNPSVAGMAAEDNQITLNPYSPLTNERKVAVAQNEAMRLYMRENDINPQFEVTPEQTKYFASMEYGKPENAKYMRQTILSRIFSGDPTANATPEQIAISKRIADGLLKSLSFE